MKKVIVAIIFIAISVLSFLAGGWYGNDQGNGSSPKVERKVLYYVDPMTPGFRSDKPGIAPCGMPLEPVYADADDGQEIGAVSMSPGAVKISQARQQLVGVSVKPVALKPMTYILRLYGRIVSDETKIYRVNASTDSWVRDLSNITTGSIVQKDQILAEVLAPAFYNAQVTYLVAMDNLDRIRQQLGEETRHQQTHLADNQIRMAVQALQNLGIPDAQIEELANTRQARPYLQVRSPVDGVVLSRNLTLYQWFKAGEEFYEIADIGRVWVYADVYENEVMHLRPGMDVNVMHKQMGKTFDAKVSQVLPLFDSIAKTLKVRLDVDNIHYDLRPDMFVDVEIPITMPPSLHLPADAVIDTGTRKIIYVDMGNGIFEPRSVETGWRLGRQIEITGGIMPGEKVLISGNFLIDSESRMKTAAAGIQSAKQKDLICGMEVDEEKATLSGMTAEYANKTFYFCSEWCKEKFEKEPEKYVKKVHLHEKEKNNTAITAVQSWVDMLEPVKASHVMKKSGTFPGQEMQRTIGTPSDSQGFVDWDGPESERTAPRDWGVWGKFPGAQYLGQKEKTKKTSTRRRKVQGAGKDTPPVDEQDGPSAAPSSGLHHQEIKNKMQNLPASGKAAPSAN